MEVGKTYYYRGAAFQYRRSPVPYTGEFVRNQVKRWYRVYWLNYKLYQIQRLSYALDEYDAKYPVRTRDRSEFGRWQRVGTRREYGWKTQSKKRRQWC